MKKLFVLALVCFLGNVGSSVAQKTFKESEELVWHTDLKKAYEISKLTNRPIFAFFTGSDWCGWCHRLQRNVLKKPEFMTWAREKVVLLELDFPRNKQLPPELAQQNAELQQAFQVSGFPTIWIFSLSTDTVTKKMNVAALGSLGYPRDAEPGREEVKFINDANMMLANYKGQ